MSAGMTCSSCGAALAAGSETCRYCGAANPYFVRPVAPSRSTIGSQRASPVPPAAPFVAPTFYAYAGTMGKAVVILNGLIALFIFILLSTKANMISWWYAAGGGMLSLLFALLILICGPLSIYWTIRAFLLPDSPWQARALYFTIFLYILYVGLFIAHFPIA